MKKMSKILLSALMIFSIFFTSQVNAEEQTTTSGGTQSSQSTVTTKTIDDLTEEDFNKIVTDTIDVSMTKTEYANYIISTNYFANGETNPIWEEVKNKVISLFSTNGYTIDSSKIDVGFSTDIYELEEKYFDVSVGSFKKTITVNYVKEDNYSTTDEEYVKNKVKSIKLPTYDGKYVAFTMYALGDEENANKWDAGTYDFAGLVNDNSITVKSYINAGGMGGGTPWGAFNTILCFYKNDILYASMEVVEYGAYGTTLENGTPINMATLDSENDKEIYEEMKTELSNRGLTNILGAYELTAYGETENGMNISFTLGTDYNGKEVQILHKKSDNTYEIFTATVEDGKATITVSELSPFMIALSNSSTTTTETTNTVSNNAQTSSMNIVLYSSIAIGSLLGITYIVVKGRKKEA